MQRARIIHNLIGRLESDLFLGARWLPLRAVVLDSGAQKTTTSKEVRLSAKQNEERQDKEEQLAAVAQAVATCTKCPLHQTRTNPVPGAGNPDARLVFVGEAPGQMEDEQGLPFVGRAGKLLTEILEAMGLTRDEVFICNILKSRPPDNRDPQPTEVVACMDYLYQQLQIIAPEVIVALGAHAAHTLLETTTPIGQLRGKVHVFAPDPLTVPIKLIATYHPAYLLRNYTQDARRKVWQDMQRVLGELDLPVPTKSS